MQTPSPRIADLPRNLTDVVPGLKTRLGCCRVHAELGTADFEPEPLRTLPVGDDLGFGEGRHGVIFHSESAYWSSQDWTAWCVAADALTFEWHFNWPMFQSPSEVMLISRVARSGSKTR